MTDIQDRSLEPLSQRVSHPPFIALDEVTGPTAHAAPENAQSLPRIEKRSLWGEVELITPEGGNRSAQATEKINKALISAWNSGETAAWIVARVVFQELQLTVPEYMRISGLEKPTSLYHALKPLSNRGRQGGLRDDTYAELLRDWRSLSTTLGAEHEPVLTEASKRLKSYLLGKDSGTPFGLLRGWALDIGPQEFESKTGVDISALRKGRHNRSKFLSYTEFVDIAQRAELLPEAEKPLDLWDHPVSQEIKRALWNEAGKFHRSKSVATALMIFEAIGIGKTVEDLHKNSNFTLPWSTARSLHQYDIVPWSKISPIFSDLVRSGTLPARIRDNLREMWKKEERLKEDSPSFAKAIRQGVNAQNITWSSILSALQVQDNSAIEKPKDLIRFALEHELRYSALPIGVLAFFAANTAEQADQLLDVKRTEITQTHLRRERASTNPHPIRVERELWSIDLEDIGNEDLQERIQATEWHRRSPNKLSGEETAQVLNQIRKVGFEKAEAALTNWGEENAFHPAAQIINDILTTHPEFSIADFREQMVGEIESTSDSDTDHTLLSTLSTKRMKAIVHGDNTTYAGTQARLDLYRDRATLGLPIFSDGDTQQSPYE
jgi:hypothetical protein